MILKSVNEGIKFAFSLKVIVPYLIINMVIFYTLIQFFTGIVDFTPIEQNAYKVISLMGGYFIVLIIIGLAYLWVNGAVIDQAKFYLKKRSLTMSFEYVKSRYLTLVCASILFGIIIFIASAIPYIGSLLSFVVSLFLFYLYQAIIVDKIGCIDSFKKSINIFSRYPLKTFVTLLLTIVISLIVVFVFASPMLFFVISKMGNMAKFITPAGVEPQAMVENLLPVISYIVRSPYFIVYLFILSFGLAYTSAFQAGTKTRLYINARKS
jgi:hypothetical protein